MSAAESFNPSRRRLSEPTRAALVVAGVYVVVSAIYIAFSDMLVESVFSPQMQVMVQTIKGWSFVGITGLLLFFLVRRRTQLIERRTAALLATIQNSPLPIYTLCHDGRVRLWSAAAERVLGWTADEAVGQPDPMRVMYGGEAADERLKAVRADRRIVGAEITRPNRNGNPRTYVVCASRLESDHRGHPSDVGEILVILQDVTDQRREQAMDGHRTALAQTLEDFDQAVGVIGHELRTPLTSMCASAELLLSEGLGQPDESRDLLQIIHDQIRRLIEMTNNMLEAARLGSGRATWNWQTVPLADMCEEAFEILSPLIDRRRVQLAWRVDPTDLTMQSDPDAIRRLILNLAGNAARHTPEGEVSIDIQAKTTDGRRWIELTVTDTGFGMDREVLKRIGEAFATNEGGMNESPTRGAGLGLSICCRIVAAHDGRMAVASRPNEGTRIVTRLAADLAGPVDAAEPGSIIRHV